MSSFDKSLKALIENMGFKIENHCEKDILLLTKSLIKRIVDNIFRNIMIILSSIPNETTIVEKHINVTKNVCSRCIGMYDKSNKLTQNGGAVTLPMDYFSGELSRNYTSNNGNTFQSTSQISPTISRSGLELQHVGGAGVKKDVLFNFVSQECIPTFFEEHGTHYNVSKCAMNVVLLSIHENLRIIFNHIHKENCKEMNKTCPLTLKTIIRVLKSEQFMFLRIK